MEGGEGEQGACEGQYLGYVNGEKCSVLRWVVVISNNGSEVETAPLAPLAPAAPLLC
jgi:hypothetical protein